MDILNASCEIGLRWVPPIDNQVNIGSGNGMVPIGNNPLLESMLTQI